MWDSTPEYKSNAKVRQYPKKHRKSQMRMDNDQNDWHLEYNLDMTKFKINQSIQDYFLS